MSHTNNPGPSSFNNLAQKRVSRAMSSLEKTNSLPKSLGNNNLIGLSR